MPIKQTFITNYPPGPTPISFLEWLATQPDKEKSRYHLARARMDAYRQEAIDDGRMSLADDGYIWRDEQAKQQGKRQDDECLNFYDRYNKDVGITVTWTWTET
jgi:hypothetical protein